jgi:DNA replication and repair protein RecF
MAIQSLELRFFRNYRSLQLTLGKQISVFTGKNGIGKTTILEAISLLGSGRTFRNAKNSDFIHRNEEASLIRGKIDSLGLSTNVEIRIYPQGKKVFVDEKLAKSTKQLFEMLPVITFSPADHQIIEGDSTERKQFINRAASNVDWEYLEDLTKYNKALLQRNRVLKDALKYGWANAQVQDLLQPWNQQCVEFGSKILIRRAFYVDSLQPWAKSEYQRLAQNQDLFQITYEPFGEPTFYPMVNVNEVQEIYWKKLNDSLRRDLAVGSSQIGAHKDEFLLTLNGNKVKFYGSQGEKRTCALALRLGELALFREKMQKMPVLLFDDVSSELDSIRRHSLVELLRKENTQVLITATELPSILMGDVGKTFDQLDLQNVGERN